MTKHRQCPHCKSKQGFKMTYQIKGYGHEIRTFSGEVVEAEREVVDDLDRHVECIECGKHIDIEKVKTDED